MRAKTIMRTVVAVLVALGGAGCAADAIDDKDVASETEAVEARSAGSSFHKCKPVSDGVVFHITAEGGATCRGARHMARAFANSQWQNARFDGRWFWQHSYKCRTYDTTRNGIGSMVCHSGLRYVNFDWVKGG
jgi:hypothetical protein